MSDLEQNSRKYQINLGVVIHNSDYGKTRFILSESNTFIFFLNSSRAMNSRLMKTYLGLDNKKIDTLLKLKSRYLIIRNSAPLFYMTDTNIFIEDDISNL